MARKNKKPLPPSFVKNMKKKQGAKSDTPAAAPAAAKPNPFKKK